MRAFIRRVLTAALVAALVALVPGTGDGVAMDGPADLVSLGAGRFDILRNTPRDQAADLRLEYRPVLAGFADAMILLRPIAGLEVTSDGGGYLLGGLALDLVLGPLVVTPSIGSGLHHAAHGKDLGSVVEFRSSIEVGWQMDSGGRISLGFGHLSNAGLTRRNPGAEVVTLYLHLPVAW